MFSGAVSGTESPPRASHDDGDAETNALERTNERFASVVVV
jgi:hypothetical protein